MDILNTLSAEISGLRYVGVIRFPEADCLWNYDFDATRFKKFAGFKDTVPEKILGRFDNLENIQIIYEKTVEYWHRHDNLMIYAISSTELSNPSMLMSVIRRYSTELASLETKKSSRSGRDQHPTLDGALLRQRRQAWTHQMQIKGTSSVVRSFGSGLNRKALEKVCQGEFHLSEMGKRPVLIRPHYKGITLIEAHTRLQGLNLSQRLALFLHVAQLVHTHHLQFGAHGNLSPGNVLLTPKKEILLLDARLSELNPPLTSQMTEDDLFAGQILYLAPETRSQGEIELHSDSFSLAQIGLFILTGGHSPAAGLEQITTFTPETKEVLSVLEKSSSHAMDLTELFLTALETNPDQRLSLESLLGALEQIKKQA